MEIVSSASNHFGTTTSLMNLYMVHESAKQFYTEQLTVDHEAVIRDLIDSLRGHHANSATSAKDWLQQLPSTPVKPNRQMLLEPPVVTSSEGVSVLAKRFAEFEEAIVEKCNYLLDNNGLPSGVQAAIQKQLEDQLAVVQKLRRLSQTGEDRVMSV